MKFFRNMPILKKIFWIFSTIIFFILIIGASGIYTSHKLNKNTGTIFNTTDLIIVIVTIIGILYCLIMTYVLKISFVTPLNEIKEFAENLALYNFSSIIQDTRKDEFGQVIVALNKAQKNVNIMIKELINTIQDISASSEETSATVEELSSKAITINEAVNTIASGMQDSSAASEEISASIEEVDSSINELSQKAMEGSNNANKSKERATEVQNNSQKAIRGNTKIICRKTK